ncbi:MAG TPA: ABC transporter substrate-binding protein [Streptosporangiaceae bacterium]|jgi:ABC-type branched-subunit amino acid transport system substrate-binding protein
MRRALRLTAATLTIGAALACSTQPPGGSGAGAAGPGVTADAISLGYLTDLSGAISGQGRVNLAGTRLYVDRLNAAGGVCGRKIKLVVEDHGYDVQKAISLYQKTTPNVLGYVSLLGSPQLEALKGRITSDHVVTGAQGWDSHILSNPDTLVYGTPYDLEMVNGLSYLLDKKIIKRGDTVGHIYWQGSYGEDALLGSKWAAAKLGLKLASVQVDPAESDMTRQVRGMQAKGAKALLLSTLPTQTASVASVSSSAGWKVPILGNNATFLPQLLTTPAAGPVRDQLYLVTSRLPYGSDDPAARRITTAFEKAKPKGVSPEDGINVGWATAEAYTEVLKRACGSLTRQGLEKALRASTDVDTGGLLPALDFSTVGAPPSRGVYVSRPDPARPGGLRLLTKNLYTAGIAKQYKTPGQG